MPDDLQNNDTLEEGLRRAGAFHPDDLAFNRQGDLSAAQKRWLAFEAAFWLGLAAIDLGFSLTMWILYFQLRVGSVLALAVFWGLFLVSMAGLCIHDAKPILEELRDGKVDEIAGTLSKHAPVYIPSNRNKSMRLFSVEIRNQSFGITPLTYEALIDHQSYRLFYTPRNKTLVNIEPLNASNEKKHSALASLQHKPRE